MVLVENMTTQNNTRLTSLIKHIPDMIKRAIDKALAPFHIRIQDLEHRISELEGIGAGEALVALKADISKRVETDKEELEDDHVTKELDEEQQVEVVVQRSMNDVTTQMVGTDPSSCAPAGEESDTIKNTTLAQSEETKDT
ncbi:hypothetical protein HAX54_021862 [Datura stramonium]|uniref:Uncharacterized protein n=1 Tax=Datura stramonium TaxID=4076 RepID=A0ABS8UTD8_DATST|nr:hypothetical protein [Datura stramonium]